MGKRSSFKRHKNDLYRTWDARAVRALLPHLKPRTRFVEPCAGRGDLVDGLQAHGHECVYASDIDPGRPGIGFGDAVWCDLHGADVFITNPPWSRPLLHAIIGALPYKAPTWLLFDADWSMTAQSIPFMPMLRKIVPVGRLRWIPGTSMDAKDNCCWYLFDAKNDGPTIYYPRAPKIIWPWQK